MALGVLFAVVMTSTPAAQAVLTAAEAHYRAMSAYRSSITHTSRILPNTPFLTSRLRLPGMPAPVHPPQVTTGELVFQNPGMVAYVEDRWGSPLGFAFGIEGDTYRQVVGTATDRRVMELDLNKEEPLWTFVAALFVSSKPLSARCDFVVRASGTTSVVLSGRPLLAGTQWVRVDLNLDLTTHDVQSMVIVSKRGFEDELSFGSFVPTAPPGRAAFVPTVP